jgi:hypothetical protein
MNRSLPIFGLGVIFALMGVGLFLLTLRKPKPLAEGAKKAELREQEALRDEAKKMRIAAGALTAFGVVLLLIS